LQLNFVQTISTAAFRQSWISKQVEPSQHDCSTGIGFSETKEKNNSWFQPETFQQLLSTWVLRSSSRMPLFLHNQ